MFIGHFALGFAAKRVAPSVSLPVLFTAAQLADLLWPALVAAGIEVVRIEPQRPPFLRLDFVSYPYSHSLVTLMLLGVTFAYIYQTVARPRVKVFALLAALVVSHWLLDFATHLPDMPIYPGGPKGGLGLWQSVPATMLIESAMFAASLWIYAHVTRPRDGVGRWGLVGLVLLLAVSYVAATFGSPPPSIDALWISGLIGGGLILLLSWWIDAHRSIVVGARS